MPASLAALAVLAVACTGSPVEWRPAQPTAGAPPEAAGALAVDDSGRARLQPRDSVRYPFAPPAGACPQSLRFAAAPSGEVYAGWWSVRADGSAVPFIARSPDGGTSWNTPVPVDTLDRGTAGCGRPAPALAANADGYVHVAYYMWAPEGAGLFFAHSMERGTLFHAPVPVVYGDRAVPAAVATDGRLVVVAYEEPNGAPGRLALALSRSDGHIFEGRAPVSGAGTGAATAPLVAANAPWIAVSWAARADGGVGSAGPAPGARYVRIGRLR